MKLRRRKRKGPEEARHEAARDLMGAFVGHRAKRTPIGGAATTKALKPVDAAVDGAERRSRSGVWDGAVGRTFVGLFALCHRIVYGEIPLELYEIADFGIASRMATKALHVWFGDDEGAFVEFIKWSWEREKGRDAWAIANGRDRTRMRARFQFSAAMVQDYRVEKSKGRRRGR